MSDLKGKRAIVCGSTQGIGRACAIKLAERGAEIILVARHEEALKKVRNELAAEHGQSHGYLVADFAKWEALRGTVAGYLADRDPVQILVNNCGGPPAGTAVEAEPDAYLDAFTKHLVCNQVMVQATVTGMKDSGYGRIINVISTSVIAPIPNLGVSNTIRGAVANWGRTLAGELGPLNITVNNVLPGFTKTARLDALLTGRAERSGSTLDEVQSGIANSIPLRRMAQPEEFADVVAFLCSPAGGYVNGVNLPVDGGRTATQ